MELSPLRVFAEVAAEKSFTRAAEKLLRTQPAVSLAIRRLEAELDEQLIDRSSRDLVLTDAGRIVFEYARRFENLNADMARALAALRDNADGCLSIGANESTTLYLLPYVGMYRRLYPRVRVQVRRCQSSKIPTQLIGGDLELGVISYDPRDARLVSTPIYTDHLAFILSPKHHFARRKSLSIKELGNETFIAHNSASPYKNVVVGEFQRYGVPLDMVVEVPTIEAIRRLVQQNEGVSFLPGMYVEEEIARKTICEVQVREIKVARYVRLVFTAQRALSRAAKAFVHLIRQHRATGDGRRERAQRT